MYRDIDPGPPEIGEWVGEKDGPPYTLRKNKARRMAREDLTEHQIRWVCRAFYALCTHINHQLRVVIGTLREEGLLEDTIMMFTSDHGDMLGIHGLWAKSLFYENSANVPMILVGPAGDARVGHHRVDDRLVGWQDVMLTLLDLAGIDLPSTVEGMSMVGDKRHDWLYGECDSGDGATRMIHDGRFKLIYYPTGNRVQLFDLQKDPQELKDLSASPAHAEICERLTTLLIDELYGDDKAWVKDGKLVGLPDGGYQPEPNRGLSGQRGIH